MSFMPQLSGVLHSFSAFFRLFMVQSPPPIQGLFSGSDYRVETSAWPLILRDDAGLCQLVCMEYCKAKTNKLHEFLVLYFSHPNPTVTAHAVAVVDRTLKDHSQSSALASPSMPQSATEALDRINVMAQGDDLKTYLSRTHGEYDTLCLLRYPRSSTRSTNPMPSALQLSTLLLVVTNHKRNYNLYEYNCYWYAATIFEACKKLFPGYEEECMRRGDRGKCRLKIPMLATDSLSKVCVDYPAEWESVVQRRNGGQNMQQESEPGLEAKQKAFDAERQAWEEDRRVREAALQAREQALETNRKVALQAAQKEFAPKLEEAERRYRQLQDELRAVKQTSLPSVS